MVSLLVCLVAASLAPDHEYFAAQVENARLSMNVWEEIRTEPTIHGIRSRYRGAAAAGLFPLGPGWLVVYDPGWLARSKRGLGFGTGYASWTAYHEVCHIALDPAVVARPPKNRAESDRLEAKADDCADKWVAELKRLAKSRQAAEQAPAAPRKRLPWWALIILAIP